MREQQNGWRTHFGLNTRLAEGVDELVTVMVLHRLAEIGAGRLHGRYKLAEPDSPQLVRTSAIICAAIHRRSERTLTLLWPLKYRSAAICKANMKTTLIILITSLILILANINNTNTTINNNMNIGASASTLTVTSTCSCCV